ncbi:MAG: hypothetical protein HY925_02100 [Elusimicrobia bacterium]|nr:hypothetical protein [Elusimicrobiota bacterium]
MPRLWLAAAALFFAGYAFALGTIRPLALPAHSSGGTPADIAENLRKHSDYLQGSVEELARYVDAKGDAEAKKAAADIVTWCRSERDFIHQDAGRIAGNGAVAATPAAPAAKIEYSPVEPRFE